MGMVRNHIACSEAPGDDCGSSDACVEYDTRWKCFSCSKSVRKDMSEADIDELASAFSKKLQEARGIETDTLQKYASSYEESEGWRFRYFNEDGKGGAIKAQANESGGNRTWIGKWKKAEPLFGMSRFTPGGLKITIAEGEIDAMSVYQMHGGKGSAVSLKSGVDKAVADCRSAFDYLDSFGEIYVCFDMDEQGKAAAQGVAELFGRKAKIVTLPAGFKDANEILQSGKYRAFINAWWNAKPYSPDDIVYGSDLLETFDGKPVEFACRWPWDCMNGMYGGIISPGFYVFGAGTSIGKSNILRQLFHHLLTHTDAVVGGMFLEESISTTAKAITGVELGSPIYKPEVEYDAEQAKAAWEALVKDSDGNERVMLVKHFAMSADEVMGRLNNMVKVGGCKFIILDHLTMLMSSLTSDTGQNTTQMLDKLVTDMRSFVEEHQVTIITASHLRRIQGTPHEEGGEVGLDDFRGSHGIVQISDGVLGLERNLQGTEVEQKFMTVRGLKNRPLGVTGVCGELEFIASTALYQDGDAPPAEDGTTGGSEPL